MPHENAYIGGISKMIKRLIYKEIVANLFSCH